MSRWKTKTYPAPTPEVLENGRAGREATRPLKCTGAVGCWVEVGPPACARNDMVCVICRGHIRIDTGRPQK